MLASYLSRTLDIIGTPGPIRTGGLRIRSPALYPAELRARIKKQMAAKLWSKAIAATLIKKNGVSDGT